MGKEAMRTRSGPRGLLLRQPWVDRILDGSKTWELRAHATRKRGTIFLVDVSGENWVVRGCVDVVDTVRLTRRQFTQGRNRHLVDQYRAREHRHAWVLAPHPHRHTEETRRRDLAAAHTAPGGWWLGWGEGRDHGVRNDQHVPRKKGCGRAGVTGGFRLPGSQPCKTGTM